MGDLVELHFTQGTCKRCGNEERISRVDRICGSCADTLREEKELEEHEHGTTT